MLDRRIGFIIHLLLIAGVAACGPKGGAGSDSASTGTGDSDASATAATGSTGATVATGESVTGSASETSPTSDPSVATSDGCGGGGCNPAPVCGEPCVCCCGCVPGESECGVFADTPVALRCAADGGCFEAQPCGDSQHCVVEDGVASCVAIPGSCMGIEADYEAIVDDPANRGCDDVDGCKVISGHCGVGLGGCNYAVALGFDEAQLEALAMAYTDGGCTQGVCDCGEAAPLVCVDNLCGFEA